MKHDRQKQRRHCYHKTVVQKKHDNVGCFDSVKNVWNEPTRQGNGRKQKVTPDFEYSIISRWTKFIQHSRVFRVASAQSDKWKPDDEQNKLTNDDKSCESQMLVHRDSFYNFVLAQIQLIRTIEYSIVHNLLTNHTHNSATPFRRRLFEHFALCQELLSDSVSGYIEGINECFFRDSFPTT